MKNIYNSFLMTNNPELENMIDSYKMIEYDLDKNKIDKNEADKQKEKLFSEWKMHVSSALNVSYGLFFKFVFKLLDLNFCCKKTLQLHRHFPKH